MTATPRRLGPQDADAYAALRREMLLDSPWAYGSAPGDDPMCTPDGLRGYLTHPEKAIFAAWERDPASGAEKILAVAGVFRIERVKRRHVAYVWGVYVIPAARGRGLGRGVVVAAIEAARAWDGVACVSLSASENSKAAQALYKSLGFVPWGIEPDSVRIDGRSYGEVFMQRPL